MFQVLESLDEAHERDILHRDLKPDNILITTERGEEYATVLDFGIAKLVGDQTMETITRTGMICGTPAYLSPEQALGNTAVPASDLYSLGIVLYEMLAGIPPFYETTPMKVLLKHLNQRPDPIHVRNPNVKVPASFDAFLQKALEKEPENRFPDVASFRRGLERALAIHEQDPETVTLSSIATSQDGIRAITADYGGAAGTSTEDFVADTRTPPVSGTAPTGDPRTPEKTTTRTVAAPPQEQPTMSLEEPTPSSDVAVPVDNTGASIAASGIRRRPFSWRLIAPVLVLMFGLGFVAVWQPWLGGGAGGDAEPEQTSPAPAPAGPANVGATPPDVVSADIAGTVADSIAVAPASLPDGLGQASDVHAVDAVGGDKRVPAPAFDVTQDVVPREIIASPPGDARFAAEATSPTAPAKGGAAAAIEKSDRKKTEKKSDDKHEKERKVAPVIRKTNEVGSNKTEESRRMGFRSVEVAPTEDEKESESGTDRMGFRPVEVE